MKNFIFHHGLSGKEIKDSLPELGFMALLLNQNPTKELRRNDEKGFKY
ncbi:MAG: hypothetical protein ACKO3R_10580 [bacterium]